MNWYGTERLERAPASNRQGWDAIVGGSSMLDEPTFGLPLWLLAELGKAADRDRATSPSEEELRADAELALELAARLTGQPEVFAELMIGDTLSDVWLIELPMALARVEQNLRRFPGDLWTQIHAGDVHLTLSDPARAEQTFRDALTR